jgi:hypothetical protein
MLETIVVDPSTVTSGSSPRVALYGLLCGLWESVSLNLAGAEPADQWEQAAQAKLGSIAPRPRQAFLLTAVEGFTIAEAAEVLRTDENGVSQLLDEAAREIGAMMATDVLIIEDEPLIAMDIEDIVLRLGHRVTGVARTRTEAVKLAGGKRPASSSPTSSSPTAAPASTRSTTCLQVSRPP